MIAHTTLSSARGAQQGGGLVAACDSIAALSTPPP